ncbi:CYFA0S03e04434g1_1 [Cyberlindnera fabianii]|uniref:CYFA0S03e04434g1_1 n=1 Tax=Cyberlindnera fabianii TaxID=36022 RepID=A0A061APT2_CYBFA|nr:CYFA0S03e04434g1_1 [Cyberlindnera fabianii]
MDLRQFTTTPSNNFDAQDQRRTSISSMSSAQSGYASSAYGGAQANQTPSNSRFSQGHFAQGNPHHQHPQVLYQHHQPPHHNQHAAHQHQQQVANNANPAAQNSNWLQNSGLSVTPWIEQQAQVTNSTSSIENQNFVNSYGNNLNGPSQGSFGQFQHHQPQHQHVAHGQPPQFGHAQQVSAQHLGMSQSMQASVDSQSARVSPSSSNVLPSENSLLMNGGKNATGVSKSSSQDLTNSDLHEQQQEQQQQQQQQQQKNDIINHNDNNDSNDNDEHDIDDELIPTAIVIKNIPFAIKKEQLLEVMTKLNLPLPYAFNYHFDNGVFRGLAFANFTSTDETTTVVNQLNGREIGGRKLRVEYKKMLPLAERERIEREKREKRGQLEEQHRSTSNASLASMISISSTPSANKPLGSAGTGSVAGGVVPQLTGAPGVITDQPLQPQHTAAERYYAPIPFVSNLPIPPTQVDFNDAETLEFYSQLLFFRDDRDKIYSEIAYPATLSQNHKRIITILAQFLGLVELFDNNLILIKRRNVIHDPSPILRSQSHNTIPLLNQQQGVSSSSVGSSSQQRFRQQSVPQQGPNRIPPNFSLGGLQNANNGLSSAALLRNNPTPTRVLPPLYNHSPTYYHQQPQSQSQPQPQQSQQQPSQSQSGIPQTAPQAQSAPTVGAVGGANAGGASGSGSVQSQPTTPGLDNISRFNLQQGQWEEPTSGNFSRSEQELNDGLNNLNLNLDNGSSIWGPRSVQPTV